MGYGRILGGSNDCGRGKQVGEYIIPDQITCPKCGAINQYELTSRTQLSLSMTMTAYLIAGELAKGHPVKVIAFALANGRQIHPLEVLDEYRQ